MCNPAATAGKQKLNRASDGHAFLLPQRTRVHL